MLQKKQKVNNPATGNPAVVEFCNLNDNKKTQFLEFLLRNNITFEKSTGSGKNDYVAKVTLPKTEIHNKENRNSEVAKNPNKPTLKGIDPHKKARRTSVVDINLDKSIKITTPKKQTSKTPNNHTPVANVRSTPLQEYKQNGDIKNMNKSCNQIKSLSKESVKAIKNPKPNQMETKSKQIKTTEFLTFEGNSLQKSVQKDRTLNNIPHSHKNIKTEVAPKVNDNPKQRIYSQKQKMQKSKHILKSSSTMKKIVEKQKIVEVNNQIKKKTQEQKQICELVNKYLKIFDLKLQGQRPMKWPFIQLLKSIEEIYNQLFIKNTQSLSQKGTTQKEVGGYSNNLIRFTKDYYLCKFKNEKLVNSNLINMLYSLSFYLENEKKISTNLKSYAKEIKANQSMTASGIFMQNFEDFLSQIYQFEDLLFYLFVRNIVIGNLHKNKNSDKQAKTLTLDKDAILTYRDVVKVLTIVLGNDLELVEQYKLMILAHINSNNLGNKSEERQLKISAPQFLSTLVQDYRAKRLLIQQPNRADRAKKPMTNHSIDNCSLVSENASEQFRQALNTKRKQNTFDRPDNLQSGCINVNQHETDELTFGEETQSNLEKFLDNQVSVEICKQFWENTEQSYPFHLFEANSIEGIICDKLKKKVKEFVNILIENMSEYNSIENKKIPHGSVGMDLKSSESFGSVQKTYIMELFMKKSMNLLGSLVQMNKLKWFEELKVDDPTQEDIDIVEDLQLTFRKLKSSPDAEAIGRLCKNILTVPQLTLALEKLICL